MAPLCGIDNEVCDWVKSQCELFLFAQQNLTPINPTKERSTAEQIQKKIRIFFCIYL